MAQRSKKSNNGATLGFEVALCCPMETLSEQFAESKRLEDEIRKNLKELGCDV